jgi:hypothetical protein
MTFGKMIAWNDQNQRGIIEDRLGNTYTVERKDFNEDVATKVGLDLTFEVIETTREAYAVESCCTGLARFQEAIGQFIS